MLNTVKGWSYHSSIPEFSKTSRCLPIKTHLFAWHLMSSVVWSSLSQLHSSLLFISCILQFFSTGVLGHFWRDTILLCDTDYRLISLLGFSTVNANNTLTVTTPEAPTPFHTPSGMLSSPWKSVLGPHLPSCAFIPCPRCSVGLKCPSRMSSWFLMEITLSWCLSHDAWVKLPWSPFKEVSPSAWIPKAIHIHGVPATYQTALLLALYAWFPLNIVLPCSSWVVL